MNELYEDQPSDDKPAAKAGPKPKIPEAPSILDQLKESLSKKVERPTVFIEVPERPGIKIEISPNVSQHQMRAWRKQAGEDTKNGMDATKFACAVVGHTTVGIYVNDEQATDNDGVPFTFGSDTILDMTGTSRPIPDCVQAFFGLDPHVEAAALAILDAAGYGDAIEIVDPT
jgi:hypothetical protein